MSSTNAIKRGQPLTMRTCNHSHSRMIQCRHCGKHVSGFQAANIYNNRLQLNRMDLRYVISTSPSYNRIQTGLNLLLGTVNCYMNIHSKVELNIYFPILYIYRSPLTPPFAWQHKEEELHIKNHSVDCLLNLPTNEMHGNNKTNVVVRLHDGCFLTWHQYYTNTIVNNACQSFHCFYRSNICISQSLSG